MQQYKVFFGPNHYYKTPPTEEQRRQLVSRDCPVSPFSRFIGNEAAVRKLQAAAYDALGRHDHKCRELAFALYGPASSGKTTLVRIFAEAVGLPLVEVAPKAARTCEDVFRAVDAALGAAGVPLVEVRRQKHYVLPPCVVFLDEVHALGDGVVAGLLKATEYNDAVLATEAGRVVNCENVCWMCATTDEGRLFDAFRTRFSPVELTYLTRAEVARIVALANPEPGFPAHLCAFYGGRVPRKALEFARYLKLRQAFDGCGWDEAAARCAADEGIDKFGRSAMTVRVLRALSAGPVARGRLPGMVGKKAEELERYVLPELMVASADQAAWVEVTGRGYALTEAGREELRRE